MSSSNEVRATKMVESSFAPFDHLGAPGGRLERGFKVARDLANAEHSCHSFRLGPFRGDDTGLQGSSVLPPPSRASSTASLSLHPTRRAAETEFDVFVRRSPFDSQVSEPRLRAASISDHGTTPKGGRSGAPHPLLKASLAAYLTPSRGWQGTVW